jgi:carbon monoxide dehydrogenase subunit G
MQRVERTARIPAPPDEVFAYLSDLEKLAEWQGGITSARRTSPGPIGTGSTAEVTREMMGQRILAPLTVTDFQPPTRMVIDSEVSGVRAHATLDLVPAGVAATDLTFAMEIRGSMLTAFMEPMIASAAGGDIDASLRRLESRFASGEAE